MSPPSKRKAPAELEPPIQAKKISLIEHSYAKHPGNQSETRISEIKLKTEQRNCAKKADVISKHLGIWPQITSDQWILKTALGANIEIADLKEVNLGQSRQNQNNLSDIEKMLFGKEIKRLSELGVIKEVKNQDAGYISSIFLKDKTNNRHRLILNLKELINM